MQKTVSTYVLEKKAAQILNRAYRRQKHKSWDKIAQRFGLGNRGRAYMIAQGKLKPNPDRDQLLVNAVIWEINPKRRPVTLRRLIRRFGIPFLEKRQRSTLGVYGAGGLPVERRF